MKTTSGKRKRICNPILWKGIERIGLLAALIFITSCVPSGPVITIESSVSSLAVHQKAQTSVNVENIADLTALEAHISFDATILEVIELRDGNFIKADFVIQKNFDNAAGTIDYAVAQIDQPPVTGSGTLFQIVFRAKAPGESPIRFRDTQAAPAGVLFSDSQGMEIPVSLRIGRLKCEE